MNTCHDPQHVALIEHERKLITALAEPVADEGAPTLYVAGEFNSSIDYAHARLRLRWMTGGAIADAQNPFLVDEEKFIAALRVALADINNHDAGPWERAIHLDWEGLIMQALFDADHEQHDQALRSYLLCMDIASKVLPKDVPIAWYMLPQRRYWSRNDQWRKDSFELLRDIWKHPKLYAICPSVYDFYTDSAWPTQAESDHAYAHDNVKLALDIASEHDLCVMPWVWHRWHPSNPSGNGNEMIGQQELAKHVEAAALARGPKKTDRISGVIWFYSRHRERNHAPFSELQLDHIERVTGGTIVQAAHSGVMG